MMLLPVAALLLLASGAPAATPAPAALSTAIVILRDGTRYALTKPYEIRGTQARLSLVGGSLVAIRASDIDEDASKRATEAARAAKPAPAPAGSPAPPSLAGAAAPAAKKASMTISIEGDPANARPVTGGAPYVPAGKPAKEVHTGPRGGRYTITESGNKNYVPRTPAPKK